MHYYLNPPVRSRGGAKVIVLLGNTNGLGADFAEFTDSVEKSNVTATLNN